MHVVSRWLYIDIFQSKVDRPYNRFSQRIIGSFYIIFFVIWEQILLCSKKEVQSLASFSITFLQSCPAERSNTWNTRPCLPINKTSKWMFNEHFRSHNGMSLMSCNDLPVDGHASMLSLLQRLWQLTMIWTLLVVDSYSASLHYPTTATIQVSSLASL